MPSKNSTKLFIENGYYHIYNRGVDKRAIFNDEQDYLVFINLIKRYLSPPQLEFIHPITEITGFNTARLRVLKNFYNKVELLSFCLMPNHYHLLLKQKNKKDMPEFIQSLSTSYSMYFNKKYERQGTLFQGRYKAALILEDSYLLQVSRYIHLNPSDMTGSDPVSNYPYSSYSYYLGEKKAEWIKPDEILSYFKTSQKTGLKDFLSYESFVEDFKEDPKEYIDKLAID